MITVLTKRDRLTALPSMRAAVSDVWVPRYRNAMEDVLRVQARDAAEHWDVIETRQTVWQRQMETAQFPLALIMAVEGYQFAEGEFGKSWPLDALLAKADMDWDAWTAAWATEEGSEALLARKVEPRVRAWVESRTKSITGTTLKRASHIIKEAQVDGAVVGEIARRLQDGLEIQSRARAMMIARSATIWNYNEGAQERYREAGISRNEWLVTDDDMLCEYCEAVEAQVNSVPLGEAFVKGGQQWGGLEGGTIEVEFDVEHPPLHPSCRCALIPVM